MNEDVENFPRHYQPDSSTLLSSARRQEKRKERREQMSGRSLLPLLLRLLWESLLLLVFTIGYILRAGTFYPCLSTYIDLHAYPLAHL